MYLIVRVCHLNRVLLVCTRDSACWFEYRLYLYSHVTRFRPRAFMFLRLHRCMYERREKEEERGECGWASSGRNFLVVYTRRGQTKCRHRSRVIVGNRGDVWEAVSTNVTTLTCVRRIAIRVCARVYRLQWQRLTCLVGREWSVPWKLHDVGQRLLLVDKKTEEGWTGGVLAWSRMKPGE